MKILNYIKENYWLIPAVMLISLIIFAPNDYILKNKLFEIGNWSIIFICLMVTLCSLYYELFKGEIEDEK